MKKIIMVILVLALFLLTACQQSTQTSFCKSVSEYNLQEKEVESSQTVHNCSDNSGNAILLIKTGYPEEVSYKYYSSDGQLITKIVVDDTDQTWQYDKDNNLLQEGFYLDLNLPNYECEEESIC